MGRIRATSARRHSQCELVQLVDIQRERAQALAAELGCDSDDDWRKLVIRPDIDAVAVSTPHNLLAPISVAALQSGKHVFVEKPMARTVIEGQEILGALQSARGTYEDPPELVVGCTLRHHSHVSRARDLVEAGAIGQPYYVRGLYGHGGRPGYDQEWRVDPELGGGGELLDQGVHLIDLSRWFLGEIYEAKAMIDTCFWTGTADSDPPVKSSLLCKPGQAEDNAFLLLSTGIGQVAFLHASWTQWKNIFSFEIYGRNGSITITGLGGHYGKEQLILTERRAEGGVPVIRDLSSNYAESLSEQDVWAREWQAFVSTVRPIYSSRLSGTSPARALDGLEVLRIVNKVYDVQRWEANRRTEAVGTGVDP
jgi:predicted dehydrogenase